MKQFSLFFFLLCIFFASCRNLETISASTEVPTDIPIKSNLMDSAKEMQVIPQEYVQKIGEYPKLISPDGEKIALKFPVMDVNEQSSFVLPVLSTNEKGAVDNIKIQLDRVSTLYSFDSWSPDSTAFAGIYYDAKKFNGAETCCGEAIAITNIDNGMAQTFIYSWGWNGAAFVSWSGNSSKLSVTFPIEHNTLIIDRYGNLLRTLYTGERAFFWAGNLLYYTARKGDQIELHTLDLDTQKSNLIFANLGGLYYIAHNEKLSEILLTVVERISKQSGTFSTVNRFYILDINNQSIEKIETSNSKEMSVYPWASSPSQDYVAMKGDDGSLWIFDWPTHKFKDYGQIKELFGWYAKIDGFLVSSLDGKQKIIVP
jgi:hypothetical protein